MNLAKLGDRFVGGKPSRIGFWTGTEAGRTVDRRFEWGATHGFGGGSLSSGRIIEILFDLMDEQISGKLGL